MYLQMCKRLLADEVQSVIVHLFATSQGRHSTRTWLSVSPGNANMRNLVKDCIDARNVTNLSLNLSV